MCPIHKCAIFVLGKAAQGFVARRTQVKKSIIREKVLLKLSAGNVKNLSLKRSSESMIDFNETDI